MEQPNNDLATQVGLLTLLVAVLWKGLGYLFDTLVKRYSKNDDKNSDKLDLLLTLVQEQNLNIERISNRAEHSHETMVKLQGKEEELRASITKIRIDLAGLMEWKRNTQNN